MIPAFFLPGCHIDRVTRGSDRLVIYAHPAVIMGAARPAVRQARRFIAPDLPPPGGPGGMLVQGRSGC